MATPDPSAVTPDPPRRPPLAEKALSEAFAALRYRDTSALIWKQQQLQATPPQTYLHRSQSTWYSNRGNQPVLVRDRRVLRDQRILRPQTESRICSVQ